MASTALATPLQPQANSHRKQALKGYVPTLQFECSFIVLRNHLREQEETIRV